MLKEERLCVCTMCGTYGHPMCLVCAYKGDRLVLNDKGVCEDVKSKGRERRTKTWLPLVSS